MLIARAAAGDKGCCLRLADEVLLSPVGPVGVVDPFRALYDHHSRATHSLARREWLARHWLARHATPRTLYRISS
jgi:hypothetical protein